MSSIRSLPCVAIASLLALPLACSSSTDSHAPDEKAVEPLAFEPCEPVAGHPVDCATMSFPLRRGEAGGKNIDYFVRRYASKTTPVRGRMWLVQGGPGPDGMSLVNIVDRLGSLFPDFEFYTPDHRGTGRSGNLECPGDRADTACQQSWRAKLGDDVLGFSTTEAARDLGDAIDRVQTDADARGEHADTFVYGSSYGTYVVNRYLHLFPKQPAGAILDAVCKPSGCADLAVNPSERIGRRYLDLCKADAFCAAKLGGDPAAFVEALFRKIDGGHCAPLAAAGVTTPALKGIVVGLLESAPPLREAVLPLLYRIDRCAESDGAAMMHFAKLAESAQAPTLGSSSRLLMLTIAQSEFLREPFEPATVEGVHGDAALLPNAQLMDIVTASRTWTWPRYEPGPTFGRWAETDAPVLLLNGTLDLQSPDYLLADAKAHFTKRGQSVVFLPHAGHVTLVRSLPDPAHPELTCGASLVRAFVSHPTAPLSTECAERTPPLDFRGDPRAAQEVFGTKDLWD